MLYHQDSRQNSLSRKRNTFLILIVVVGATVLLSSSVRSLFSEAAYAVVSPVWSIGDAISNFGSSIVTNFRDKQRLISENEALTAELARVQAQMLDRNLLAEKVVKLEESLGRTYVDDRVVARVLIDPAQSSYDVLVVDAGENEGVRVGDKVVFAGSGAIGEVSEVTSGVSKVKLFSSPGQETRVLVGTHYVPANALGRGMGNFEAKVPEGSAVALGDTILATKNDLILGTVLEIEEKEAEPFKRIFFRSPFNITEIHTVEIILSKKS